MEPTREETSAPSSSPVTPAAARTEKKLPIVPIAIVVAVLVLVLAGLYTKGLLVVAIVDGSPITRLAVINELERKGGEQALKALIDQKLIEKGFAESNIVVDESAVDAKIAEIEAQISGQGGTLADALAAQGMELDTLRTQIRTQIGLEKLLAEKAVVTPEEVDAYIASSDLQLPEGVSMDDIRAQLGEQMQQQKFAEAADAWIREVTEKSDIKYILEY